MKRTIFAIIAAAAWPIAAHAQQQQPKDVPMDLSASSGGSDNPDMDPTQRGSQLPPPPNNDLGPTQGGDNGEGGTGGKGKESGLYYNTDEGGDLENPDEGTHYPGTVPDVHVVKRGDTLWDICYYYFNNPWEWPKVWSYNPTITNPHWIYPGDLLRLYPAGQSPTQPQAINNTVVQTETEEPKIAKRVSNAVELRQLAFVANDDLKFAGKITGSTEEKTLLSPGDDVFIEYPEGHPPQLGHRYAVYADSEKVKHPDSGKVVGEYVLLRGEVVITEVKKDKRARGQITYLTDVIERGMHVGSMKTQFKDVTPRAPDKDLEGIVVARIGVAALIGDREIVFIDRGTDDGVKPGDQFRLVRRGDAKIERGGPQGDVGQDDRRYPDHSIGSILVVEVAKNTSVAIVLDTKQETGIGDHVVMRKPKQ
jgi:hypothetical protein